MVSPQVNEPLSILKTYWGYDSFRPLQEDIVRSVLDGHHTLALLPTGGGKSVCFQVPALCMEGICIVVSPLIALMKDQVGQLNQRGIKAFAIYSGMSRREIDITLDNCIYGNIKFLYVSPERIKTELFIERARQMKVSMVAIDEAHCISQWGYDFRPPYLEISDFIENLEVKRVIALTASATKEVKEDIISKLKMEEAKVFMKSFARPNLSYSVFKLENKEQKLLEILQRVSGSSVVYVRSRKQTKEISDFLIRNGIKADYYHAGIPGELRAEKQDKWISNKVRVVVATNAFGMGIDKPDVRTVIHMDLPDSLEAYYQEAGRAGRDGKKAYAVQLFMSSDITNLEARLERSFVSVDFMKRVYQALANYYKLAVGSNANSSFDFDYQVFIQNFSLPFIETYFALKKLSDEGLIQLDESFKESSRIMVLLSQESLYKYQVAHQSMDMVIKVLLRLYGGELFTTYVQIREKEIAALLKEPVKAVVNQLEYLHQAEVIEYRHATDNSSITFLTARFDANDLPLDKTQIEWRRKVTLQKADAVKQYVENNLKCRSRVIQEYFGETSYADCGVCDVCLERNRKVQSVPLDAIIHYLKTSPKSEMELLDKFSKLSDEELITGLRYLMDQNKIALTVDEKFEVKKG